MIFTLRICEDVIVTCFGPSMGRQVHFAACHRQPDGSDLIEKLHILPGVTVNKIPPKGELHNVNPILWAT